MHRALERQVDGVWKCKAWDRVVDAGPAIPLCGSVRTRVFSTAPSTGSSLFARQRRGHHTGANVLSAADEH